ncbi:MAG: sulfur carrier protein ThiS [Gammaproteobacteria bacterium]|nr:sulfur carrier protein ThiS [Gammaproteobacteria bacterium]
MQIILNGETKALPDSSTAQQLVELLGLADKRLAMEVNQEIVPRSTYDTHILKEGDKVEIVHAIGGGSGLF